MVFKVLSFYADVQLVNTVLHWCLAAALLETNNPIMPAKSLWSCILHVFTVQSYLWQVASALSAVTWHFYVPHN